MNSGRLRVLLSAYACAPGRGSEPGVGWNAAVALARHHDVWVLTQDEGRPAIEQHLASNPIDGLTVSFFDVPGFLYRRKLDSTFTQLYYPRWQRAILPVAQDLHARIGFDLVHHITIGRYWQPSHLWRLGIPFVFGPVGGGESAPPSLRRSYGWRGMAFEVARNVARSQGGRAHDVRDMIRNAAVCLTSTTETRRRLEAAGARRTVMIPGQTGLGESDLAHFDSMESTMPEVPRFVAMARLLHWKGLHFAIEALAASHLLNATLDVVGDGPDRRRLEALARRLGLSERVRFLGDLPRERALEVLAGGTALVHPAVHDFSPTVIFEAMGMGKPVIALDLNGPATQLTQSTGILVPATTSAVIVAGLAEAMRKLASDRRFCTEMGAVGRRVARERYTWERKGQIYDDIYRQITGTAARKPKIGVAA